MIFNPLTVFNTVSKSYEDYVKSTFFINDKIFRDQFNLLVEKGFTKGPIIECTDSFITGGSIYDLVQKKQLNPGFTRIIHKESELHRNLYKHQIDSIERSSNDRNVVITTGTGSGKTECFLYPILNTLLNEIDKKTLSPGVRALLLYPMNALANDQMKRLRELLEFVPEITFGAYTGETKDNDREALGNYQDLFGKKPLSNEIISRQAMKENPPHILLTNYAMLEYLLLRPNDNVFFDGEKALYWKYIVLDEAHTYRGASGIEISYLIRRLYYRLQAREKIRFILTSATLGNEDKNAEIINFATNISAGLDYTADDIIRAQRKEWKPQQTHRQNFDITIYSKLLDYFNSLNDINKANHKQLQGITGISFSVDKSIYECLYELIIQDPLYNEIRNYLQRNCVDLYTIANHFNLDPVALSSFFTIAGMAQVDSLKLVDLRYHAFIRSLEGVYVTFFPEKTLSITPRKIYPSSSGDFFCYKLSVCQFCGQMYLEGNRKGTIFSQPEAYRNSIYQVLDDDDVQTINDLSDNDDQISRLYSLCTKCSTITEYSGVKGRIACACSSDYSIILLQVQFDEGEPMVHTCGKCKGINPRGSILRGFYIGSNAASSILAASIFENLPYKKVETNNTEKPLMGQKALNTQSMLTKRLLVFSDNRQDAAFFAVYLQSTYNNLLKRRLLLKTARECAPSYLEKGIPLTKLAHELSRNFELEKIIDVSGTNTIEDPVREAWKTLLYEIQTGERNGLANLGFMQFKYVSNFDNGFSPFNENELKNIDELLMESFMKDGALALPVKLTAADYKEVLFQPSPAVFTKEREVGPRRVGNTHAWIGKNNRRVRLLRKTRKFNTDEEIQEFLKVYWDSKVVDQIQYKILESNGDGFQLLPECITVQVAGFHNFKHMRCNICGKVSLSNFMNKCMQNRCSGALEIIDEVDLKTYQRKNLEKENFFKMVVQEHTAQLGHKKAAEYQKNFVTGKTHVLSCSTTFEMGVDVGDLETVFMRNMPPTPANYIQRAGRAGRRVESTAFALTYCKLANHDLTFYKNPEKMVHGVISPPSFKLTNDKIAARHVYSAILSAFWRQVPEIKKIEKLFEEEVYGKYKTFLDNSISDVYLYIQKFTAGIYEKEKLLHFITEYSKEDGSLDRYYRQYLGDIKVISDLINEKYENKESKGIQQLENARKTIAEQNIISFFSRNNLIPKYGFPVDTVELYANLGSVSNYYGNTSDLKLQRDMSIAVSEYAPGSEVIANGMIYKSAYVKPAPNKNQTWRQYTFGICDNQQCKNLNIFPYFEQEIHKNSSYTCSKCGKGLVLKDVFIIPEYGFIASNENPERASTRAPMRTARAKTHYVGSNDIYTGNIRNILTYNGTVTIIQKDSDTFTTINQQKYFICHTCGYTETSSQRNRMFSLRTHEHKNSLGYTCGNKKLYPKSLGYTFKTDAIALTFNTTSSEKDYSILYMLLEGMARYFDIERNDIDGTVHYGPNEGSNWVVYFVFYDTVPGGAGHTKRIMECNDATFMNFLKECYNIVANCTCGDNEDGECACYSCLCNYYNQFYHEQLNRKKARDFLDPYVNKN